MCFILLLTGWLVNFVVGVLVRANFTDALMPSFLMVRANIVDVLLVCDANLTDVLLVCAKFRWCFTGVSKFYLCLIVCAIAC